MKMDSKHIIALAINQLCVPDFWAVELQHTAILLSSYVWVKTMFRLDILNSEWAGDKTPDLLIKDWQKKSKLITLKCVKCLTHGHGFNFSDITITTCVVSWVFSWNCLICGGKRKTSRLWPSMRKRNSERRSVWGKLSEVIHWSIFCMIKYGLLSLRDLSKWYALAFEDASFTGSLSTKKAHLNT